MTSSFAPEIFVKKRKIESYRTMIVGKPLTRMERSCKRLLKKMGLKLPKEFVYVANKLETDIPFLYIYQNPRTLFYSFDSKGFQGIKKDLTKSRSFKITKIKKTAISTIKDILHLDSTAKKHIERIFFPSLTRDTAPVIYYKSKDPRKTDGARFNIPSYSLPFFLFSFLDFETTMDTCRYFSRVISKGGKQEEHQQLEMNIRLLKKYNDFLLEFERTRKNDPLISWYVGMYKHTKLKKSK